MRSIIKKALKQIGLRTGKEYQYLQEQLEFWQGGFVPPGHYYSPLNDLADLRAQIDTVFNYNTELKDINLKSAEQYELLQSLAKWYPKLPFVKSLSPGLRYYYDNIFYSYSDGIFLFCLLNHIRPKQVIEVGSGFSSAAMLDTNELFFENNIDLTFIEPYPEERLRKLVKDGDKVSIVEKFVQQIGLEFFQKLGRADILFIDSSHVSKFRSDLNYILFEILPVLASGVYIHFHDIFFPFEYPKEWILQGRAWNETYLLRAFLMNNKDYEIVLFPSYLESTHAEWLTEHMPLTMELHEKWPGEENFKYFLPNKGQSLWLRKL
jgi:predicted O-methyltransferase YrrM